MQIEKLLSESSRVQMIDVYGTDGVGKTNLLKKIYNTHKEVSDAFDAVIWVIVARFPILKLQGSFKLMEY